MKVNILSRTDAVSEMQRWQQEQTLKPLPDPEYREIRSAFQKFYMETKEEYEKGYQLDVHFGMKLYEYLNHCGFSMGTMADDGFWRYLTLIVSPDLVSARWGADNESHFWKTSARIWFKALWWYIHLSWQHNLQMTLDTIEDGFSNDEILNLVERTGRKGYNVEVYRKIVKGYSRVSESEKRAFQKNNRSLFRAIMILNTAKTVVMEPGFYQGGETEYVKQLFAELGITL